MTIISNNIIKQVFGALLGIRTLNKIEVFYSFEFLNLTPENQQQKFDLEFIENRKSLTDQLFQNQNYELLGFYCTTPNLTDYEISNLENSELKKIMEIYNITEPVFLVLGTDIDNKEELPINFYSSKNSIYDKIPHKIEGSDSERITLDTVMKFSEKEVKESATKQNLKAFKNALDVLRFDLNNILNTAEDEKFKNDASFQSLLSDLISNFPTSNSSRMNQIIEDKNHENAIMNNLCSCTFNNVYLKNYELVNNSNHLKY